ncbi:MAG: Ig-like domain-containing protein, partial [Candidatus Symbiothrix sp.]|nr:Ig-like domain-containing protein [Candidatus Symbiothrix sp.]
AGAILDLSKATGKGLLLPKVDLQAADDFTVAGPEAGTSGDGMLVYNTAETWGEPGIYVWDGAKWNPVAGGAAPVPATGVSVSPTTLDFTSQTTATLTAIVEPPKAVQTVTWDSDNTDVATVSADGVVTAVSNGNATITVTTESGKTATCAVSVSIAGSSDAKIGDNTYATYCYGGTIGCWMVQNSMEGTANYQNGNNLYYSWDQRNNACVSPWAVPTESQWRELQTYINGSPTAEEKAMWNAGAALAGYYQSTNLVYSGSRGYWWLDDAPGNFFYCASNNNLNGPGAYNNTYSLTVRCIKN